MSKLPRKTAIIASIWGTVVFFAAQKIVGPRVMDSDGFRILFILPLLSFPWIPLAFREEAEAGAKPNGLTLIVILALGGLPTLLFAFPLILLIALLSRFAH